MIARITHPLSLLRITCALLVLAVVACSRDRRTSTAGGDVANWSPAKPTTFAGVPAPALQSAIQARLAAAPPAGVAADSWHHAQALYSSFGGAPLWLDESGIVDDRVNGLKDALAASDSDAIRTNAYPTAALEKAVGAARHEQHPTAEQLAEADVLLTTTFAVLGEDLLTGQVNPRSVSQSWFINRQEENVDSTLARGLRDVQLDRSLGTMRPQDPGYRALQGELMRYRQLAAKGDWATVPKGRALKPGERDDAARLRALANRLTAEGLADEGALQAAAPDSAAGKPGVPYSPALAGAVADFQARHGINVDSILGPETVDALNKPVSYRLGQIAANLERYRWLPRTFGSRYILVNVPAFQLQAFDGGKPALEMKVIVGAEYENRATPTFSDSMEYVVFRPYWIVPDTIAMKEIYPKVQQDPSYLDRNDYEIVTIDRKRRVRQKPGPKNSLGLVKFMFPNDFNIYLHDTPQGELFQKDVRAFSHGCIRLEHPDQLAQFVLGWSADSVHAQMQAGPDDHRVTLPQKVPVYIVYFTTYVRDNRLYFGNDLYNRDEALVKAVASAAAGAAAPTAER